MAAPYRAGAHAHVFPEHLGKRRVRPVATALGDGQYGHPRTSGKSLARSMRQRFRYCIGEAIVDIGENGFRYRCPINPTQWYDLENVAAR